MKLLPSLLRVFFRLLYSTFAWSYDLVSAVVSLGRWNDWVRAVGDLVGGEPVLELGHGPGHLQVALYKRGIETYGIDASSQMSRQAKRRINRSAGPARLARATAEALPFPSGCFGLVVATFPSEYIFSPATLGETLRVLRPEGELVVLFAAWPAGDRISDRFIAWLYRTTGQLSPEKQSLERLAGHFTKAGFDARSGWIMHGSTQLFVLQGRRSNV